MFLEVFDFSEMFSVEGWSDGSELPDGSTIVFLLCIFINMFLSKIEVTDNY